MKEELTSKTQVIAKEFAIKNKYDTAKFYKRRNNSFVFIAEMNTDKPAYTGYPTFIIVSKDVNVRFAKPKEILDIMDIHPVDKSFLEKKFTS